MKKHIYSLEQYWFSPLPASRLAILRIVSGLFALWYLLWRYDMLLALPANDLSMYAPVGLMKLFSTPFSPGVFTSILLCTIVTGIVFTVGWKYRYTGPLFAILLLLFFSYRNSWSMIYHNYIALVLHILIIGFTPAADAFSIDARKVNDANKSSNTSWQYGWPVKLICLGTAITYFICGIAKLLGNLAFDWISGDAMRSQVAVDTLRKNVMGETTSPLFEWLFAHSWIFFVMGVMTMAVELSAPFIMGKKRIIQLWVLLALLMHWGIFFIMGIRFYHQMAGIIFLPFLEPEKWWYYLKEKFSVKNKPNTLHVAVEPKGIILFDGVCNFCNSTVQFIINRDPDEYFQFASLQSDTAQQLLSKHAMPATLSTIVLVEKNKVYAKSSAALRIAGKLNSFWKLAYVLLLIPAPLRDLVYTFIAKSRYRWFGKTESCSIPGPHIRKRFLTV